MSSYSHEPDELLQALRGDLPGAAEKDRVRARLVALGLGAASLAPAATVGAQAASSSAGALGKVGLFGGKKIFLALALTGAAGTAVWTGANKLSTPGVEMRTLPSAESSHVQAPAAVVQQKPEPVVTPLEPSATVLRSAPVQRRNKRARVVTDSENTASTLREESVLLGQAIAALRDGQLDEAGRLLALHRAQFPQGLLAHERELAEERLKKAHEP